MKAINKMSKTYIKSFKCFLFCFIVFIFIEFYYMNSSVFLFPIQFIHRGAHARARLTPYKTKIITTQQRQSNGENLYFRNDENRLQIFNIKYDLNKYL